MNCEYTPIFYSRFIDDGFVVVDSLFIATSIVCGGFVFGHCFVMQYLCVYSSFAIILLLKRELVALL